MITPSPAVRQSPLGPLLRSTALHLTTGLVAGAVVWGPLLALCRPAGRLALLVVVIGNQAGFFLVALLSRRRSPEEPRLPARALLTGVGVMLVAAAPSVLYDEALRRLFGAGTPTLGPWGAVRDAGPWAAALLVAWGVTVGPCGDECFFRAGLFGVWAEAGRPWIGAVVSASLFALSRLDLWNLPAYLVLGLLLTLAYQRAGLLASVTAHALLNAALLLLLFGGYQ